MEASPSRRRSTRRRSSIKNLAVDVSDSSAESSASELESQDDDDDFKRPATAKRGKTKSPSKRASKRSRTTKTKKVASVPVEEQEDDPDRVENFLYEAIIDPETSIETLITDFLESYEEDGTQAMRDLINFVLRCCGTKQEITAYDVEDADTIPETLTQLQDHLTGKDQDVVKVSIDTYPLVSKVKSFKTFRKDLSEFWRVLITHAADKQILYNDEAGKLASTIEAWLVSMSSSALRSFRHTATTICLTIMTTMVELSAKLRKDLETATKQLAIEEKKSKKTNAKMKTIQKAMDMKSEQIEKLTEIVANYFDAVFVHRYRDIDGKIRSESIRELGVWMMKLPETFFEGQYLRYLGWVLSDTNALTRLEVVKALTKLYGYDEYAGGLRHFTERFRPRMLEIATEDAEINIRCAALALLYRVQQKGYLEDEDTDLIVGCIFDNDEKVRHAAVNIFHSVVEDRENEIIDEQLGGNVEDDGDLKSTWTNLKAIVSVVDSIGKRQDTAEVKDTQKLDMTRELACLYPGRVSIAANAFLKGLQEVDFDSIVDYLLYDNDATATPASAKPRDLLRSVLSLTDQEEQILLEMLVASAEIHGGKANDGDSSVSEKIIRVLPQLLARFTTSQKISTCLQLLTACDLGIYTNLRKLTQFESLLDTIVKIFLGYQEETLLRDIGYVILILMQEDSLSASLKDKFLELQETVCRNVLNDEIEEHEVIQNLRRLEVVSSTDDCVLAFEEKSLGETTIYSALKDMLVSPNKSIRSLSGHCFRNYFMWKIAQLTETRFGLDAKDVTDLISQRDDIFYILDAQVEEGDEVAAMLEVDLEKIFTCLNKIESFDGQAVRHPIDINLQTLIIKIFQKSMKRYAKLHNRTLSYDEELASDDEEDEESEDEDNRTSAMIESERRVCILAGEIVSAIAVEKLDKKYIELLLSNKGKLGNSYDAILKELPVELTLKKAHARTKAKGRPRKAQQSTANEEILMGEEGDEIED